jgi:hypothetical protein
MPIELYALPNPLLGLLVCSGWILIGIGGQYSFHRLGRATFSDSERNLAIALLAWVLPKRKEDAP